MRFSSIYDKYKQMPITLKASIWFFVCTFLQKGISVITTPIFTRFMDTSEYGVFNIYGSWSDVLAIFITFGLSSSVYQKKIVQLDNEHDRDVLTSSLQGLATITAVCSLTIYLLFRNALNNALGLPTDLVISIYVSTIATTAFGFWSMRQRVDYKYKALVLITIITCIAKPSLGLAAIFLFPSEKVRARVYAIVIVEVVAYVWFYISHFKKGKVIYVKEYWKYAIGFVLPLIPHFLSQRILGQSDKIMISSMIGQSEAGIYSLAHQIGWLMTLVITALDYTMAPWTYSKLKEKNIHTIKKYSIVPILFMAVASFAFIACAPELITIFAPEKYQEATWMVPPLVMSTYFMLIYTMFIYVEYYHEKTRSVMIATLGSALLNVVLNYICIKMFGYYAAAYTSLFCYVAYACFHFLIFKKICKDEYGLAIYDMGKIAVITIVFVSLSFLMMAFYRLLPVRLIILFVLLIILIVNRNRILASLKEFSGNRN